MDTPGHMNLSVILDSVFFLSIGALMSDPHDTILKFFAVHHDFEYISLPQDPAFYEFIYTIATSDYLFNTNHATWSAGLIKPQTR